MMTTMTVPHLAAFPGFTTRGNPALEAALSALPGHDEQAATKARLTAAMQSTAAAMVVAHDGRADLVEATKAALLAGRDVPATMARDAHKAAAALAQAQAAHEVLKDVRDDLARESDALLRSAPDHLLAHLDGQLQALVADARALDLGGVTDAEQAIENGAADAWREFVASRTAYFRIRDAQRIVLGDLVRDFEVSQHTDTFGAIRNYGELFPAWLAAKRNVPELISNGESVTFRPPWPTDAPEFWLYVVTHPEVELWVPTPRQIRDAYQQARADALRTQAAEEAAEDATPEQRAWLQKRRDLERQFAV